MKVLLDEGVPHPLIKYLPGHDVETVIGRGWASVKNGRLLKLVADEGFEVFVTGDKNIPDQQSILNRPFAFLLLSTINWPIVRQNLPAIVEAIDQAVPRSFISVYCGEFHPRPKWKPSGR